MTEGFCGSDEAHRAKQEAPVDYGMVLVAAAVIAGALILVRRAWPNQASTRLNYRQWLCWRHRKRRGDNMLDNYAADNDLDEPKRLWPWVALVSVLAIVAVAAISFAAWAVTSRDDEATASPTSAVVSAPEYWETPAGKLEMSNKAKAVISFYAAEHDASAREFGPAKIDYLGLVMWSDLLGKDGKTSRLWFKVGFAGGANSVQPFPNPKVAATESEL